jgi:hypothetical protein
MDYGNMLSHAWQLTWRHKVLWIFGLLAALGSVGNGGTNWRLSSDQTGVTIPPAVQQQFERPEFVLFAVVAAFVALAVVLALIVITTIARAGLIGGIARAEEQGRVTFREAWSIGTHYFWRMVGIALMLIVPALAFGLLAVLLVLATFGLGALLVIPLACVLALAYIPFAIVAHFAQFAVVLDDLGVGDAFRKGWAVLQTNLGPIIVLGLLIIVIGFVVGLLIFSAFLALALPVAAMLAVGGARLDVLVIASAAVAFLLYLPIALVLSGILQTWTTAAWTLAWKHFTGAARVATTTVPPAMPIPA